MTWPEELACFWRHARGDLAVLLGLCAMRKTENGGPGRELGVLSTAAESFEAQARVTANSFRNHEQRCKDERFVIRDPATGLYSQPFLRSLSARWAPTTGATNDPHGMNQVHADNLWRFYHRFALVMDAALEAL